VIILAALDVTGYDDVLKGSPDGRQVVVLGTGLTPTVLCAGTSART
jgi:hypothetical protein